MYKNIRNVITAGLLVVVMLCPVVAQAKSTKDVQYSNNILDNNEESEKELKSKMKDLYVDNIITKEDIINQVMSFRNNSKYMKFNRLYTGFTIENFIIIPSTVDKEGRASGNLIVRDNREIIIPFSLPIEKLNINTQEEEQIIQNVNNSIYSIDINRNTDYDYVQDAINEKLHDDDINVNVINIWTKNDYAFLGNYKMAIHLYSKDKKIDKKYCVKGYIYNDINELNKTITINKEDVSRIIEMANQSLYNLYTKNINKDIIQSTLNKILGNTYVRAEVFDYVQIPATSSTYREIFCKIIYTDTRNNTLIIKYVNIVDTDEIKISDNNQTMYDFQTATTYTVVNFKASNNTTMIDVVKAISGNIRNDKFWKCITDYKMTPATAYSDGKIEFEVDFGDRGPNSRCSHFGYVIDIPKLS